MTRTGILLRNQFDIAADLLAARKPWVLSLLPSLLAQKTRRAGFSRFI
jgi:hypothetical protein